MAKQKVIMGIDPGGEGAIGIISLEGDVLDFIKLDNQEPEYVADVLKKFKEEYTLFLVGMELVHTMPNQGVASSGKFMENKGIMRGILAAYRIQYIEITPQKWRKLSHILATIKGDTKSQIKKKSLTYVDSRWPQVSIKKIIKHIDICDSLCIAEYVRLKFLEGDDQMDAKERRLEEAREWMRSIKEKQHADRAKRVDAKKRLRAKKTAERKAKIEGKTDE